MLFCVEWEMSDNFYVPAFHILLLPLLRPMLSTEPSDLRILTDVLSIIFYLSL